MSKLSIRIVAALGAGICGAVATGLYQLNEAGELSLRGFVGITAAGAGAAVVAFVGAKFAKKNDPQAPKP